MKHILTTVILAIFATTCIMAQEQEYPIKTINGKECYEYTIKAGDGLYAISKLFEVSQSDLHEFNPNLTTDIKAGDVIYIPIRKKFQQRTLDENAKYHVVEPQQTMYGIAKIYNIPLDTLIKINPWSTRGIKVGDKLLLTNDAELVQSNDVLEYSAQNSGNTPPTHTVKPKETLFGIAKSYNITIQQIIDLNPEINDGGLKSGAVLKLIPDADTTAASNEVKKVEKETKKETIKVKLEVKPTEQPEELPVSRIDEEQATAVTEYDTTISEQSPNKITLAYLLPFMTGVESNQNTENFIEFYRGSLIALEEAKKHAISADVYTYDTYRSAEKIDSILDLPEMRKVDYIVGPAYSDELQKVTDFARKNDIATIVPFTRIVDSECSYDKLIQFNPSQELLFDKIVADIANTRNYKYVIARFADCDNKGSRFADRLTLYLTEQNIEYKELIINNNIEAIATLLSSDSTLLILASSAPEDISPVIYDILSLKDKNLMVWGFEEWNSLLNIYPNTLYYSLFNPEPRAEYVQQYVAYFGAYPTVTTWRYDLIGYDLTLMALLNIGKDDNNQLTISQQHDNLYQQSQPNFINSDKHKVNIDYHLFHWNGKTHKHAN